MSTNRLEKKEEEDATFNITRDDLSRSRHPQTMTTATDQRILPLSPEAISQIHSSNHITSLQGVVLRLLENSLDASATKVEITLDWKRGGCTVQDNGTGISAHEFAENGGLGRMYCTSKRAPVGTTNTGIHELHGTNGTFLAELAAMSLLSITSRRAHGHDSASVTMHHGQVITRQVSTTSANGLFYGQSNSVTTVTVKDLFGNMAVRVKQRSFNPNNYQAWTDLKSGIAALLLAWPRPCFVRLRDVENDNNILNIYGQHPSLTGALTMKSLNQLAGKPAKFDVRDTLPILFQCGLAPASSKSRWIPLSASTSNVTLKGLICLDPSPTKLCQFIAVGVHPCHPGSGNNELFETANKAFAQSSFGNLEDESQQDSDRAEDVEHCSKHYVSRAANQAQIRKSVDRHPMYSLNLAFKHNTKHSAVEVDRLSDTTMKSLSDVLDTAVRAWLENNSFRPRKRRKRRNEEQELPSVTRISMPASPSQNRSGSPRRASTAQAAVGTLQKDMHQPPSPSKVRSAGSWHQGDSTDASGFSRVRYGKSRKNASPPNSASLEDENEATESRMATTMSSNQHKEPNAFTKITILPGPSVQAGQLNDMLDLRNLQRSPFAQTARPTSASTTIRRPVPDDVPSSEDFGSVDEAELIAAAETVLPCNTGTTEVLPEDDTMIWVDPDTKQKFRVNSRTGAVEPDRPKAQTDRSTTSGNVRAAGKYFISNEKPLSLTRRQAAKRNLTSGNNEDPWLPEFLKGWSNPTFANQAEEPIPVASFKGPGVVEIDDNGKCCSHNIPNDYDRSGRASTSGDGLKLSKTALKQATVIAQVERKFILCKTPEMPKRDAAKADDVLVLVDQHAASERVILEDLLAGLYTKTETSETEMRIITTDLVRETTPARALQFEISTREHELFERYQSHFSAWGIHLNLSPRNKRLIVTHLPTTVAERCANLPSLCIDMLRAEVWALADGSKRALTALPLFKNSETPYWTVLLPFLPTHLLTMLHSRSCRSAIMFNDPLSKKECEELVQKLGGCVFPFVCAHGRVSMVPLGSVDGGSGGQAANVNFGRGKVGGTYGDEIVEREKTCNSEALRDWLKK